SKSARPRWKNYASTSRALPKTWSRSSTAPRALPGGPSSPTLRTSSSKSVKSSRRKCSTWLLLSRPRPPTSATSRIAVARDVTSHCPGTPPTRVSCKRGPVKPSGPSRKVTATAAGGLFFPQSKSLGIDQGESSPALLQKITYAGTACRSFAEASGALHHLADWTVDPKQVERVTERIRAEPVAERDAQAAAFQALPLVEKFRAPPGQAAPDLAVVMADGGRLQILDRSPAAAPPPAAPEAVAAAADPGWDEEPPPVAGHWREDKVALLLTMKSSL